MVASLVVIQGGLSEKEMWRRMAHAKALGQE